jgi:hypothetical protein
MRSASPLMRRIVATAPEIATAERARSMKNFGLQRRLSDLFPSHSSIIWQEAAFYELNRARAPDDGDTPVSSKPLKASSYRAD